MSTNSRYFSFLLIILGLFIGLLACEKTESSVDIPPTAAIFKFTDSGTSDTLYNVKDTISLIGRTSLRLKGSAGASAGIQTIHITLGKDQDAPLIDTSLTTGFYRPDFTTFDLFLRLPPNLPRPTTP